MKRSAIQLSHSFIVLIYISYCMEMDIFVQVCISPAAVILWIEFIAKSHCTQILNLSTVGLCGYITYLISSSFQKQNKKFIFHVATALLVAEICFSFGGSFMWAVSLYASVSVAVHLFNRSDKLLIDVGTFEQSNISMVWAMLLWNMFHDFDCITTATYRGRNLSLYSIEQCLTVAEIIIFSLGLTILLTESMVYVYAISATVVSRARNPVAPIYINRVSVTTCASTVAIWIAQPRLALRGVHNLPYWVFNFVVRSPGYIELQLGLYWLLAVLVAVGVGYLGAVQLHWPRTCNRKVFHVLVVALFSPALLGVSNLLMPMISDVLRPESEGAVAVIFYKNLENPTYRVFSFLVLCLGVAVFLFLLCEYVRLRLVFDSPETQIVQSVDSTVPSNWFSKLISALENYMELFISSSDTLDSQDCVQHKSNKQNKQRKQKKLELSHISLLLGCALPIWLYAYILIQLSQQVQVLGENTFAGASHPMPSTPFALINRGDHHNSNFTGIHGNSNHMNLFNCCIVHLLCLIPHVGLISLGVGDAAAAVVGKLFGKRRWYTQVPARWRHYFQGNMRTVEGSIACSASMMCYASLLSYECYSSLLVSYPDIGNSYSGKDTTPTAHIPVFLLLMINALFMLIPVVIVTIVEACTTLNDNVLLPMVMCICLLIMVLLLMFWNNIE